MLFLSRDRVLQNNIGTALNMLTIESLTNYDHESIRSLVIMLYDAEKRTHFSAVS
jgi:hypothetical protein